MKPRLQKVYVAMSGGVDSSVAAALLKYGKFSAKGGPASGWDVVGVFMKPWSQNLQSRTLNGSQGLTLYCPWKEDREDAMRAASVLGIPLETWDFSKEYKKYVTDYMIKEYKAGQTPNPDVMCNKEIKFGLFFNKAIKEGADYVATGHYVRKAQVKNEKLKMKSYKLLMARDKNKDQSYFLWTLKQKQLKKCLFPIGDYIKPEVRKMAKKLKLPNHDKKDSQGICFIGPLDMKNFLQTKIKPKRGEIRLLRSDSKGVSRLDLKDSVIIGNHDGVYYYTIGQRHGLGIGGRPALPGEPRSKGTGGPYYVVSKDIKKNIIYVGSEKGLFSKKTKVSKISWINDNIIPYFFSNKGHLPVDVKIRYRSKSEKAVLLKNGTLKFFKPVRAITSGQSAVFYRKGELLGGGIIV